MFIHHCSIIPDGPSHVQQVLLGMGPALKPERHAFYDRLVKAGKLRAYRVTAKKTLINAADLKARFTEGEVRA